MLYENQTILEVVAGREGLWGLKNTNLIPLGGALTLRNAALYEHSFRTGGGKLKIGVTPVNSLCLASVDFWVQPNANQRTIAVFADGTIRKDDGTGHAWVTLKSGLNMGGALPMFCVAGSEGAGKNRKVFYADGKNAPMYLDGDAGTMTTMDPTTQQAADWAANPPAWFVAHTGFLFAGGCPNTPHIIYRNTALTDMTNFRIATAFQFSVFEGESERIVGGLSYKGAMVLWKYPDYVYLFNTTDPDSTHWYATRVAQPGGVGPYGFAAVEDDIIWVSQDLSLHLLSATLAYGSVRATDLSYRKLAVYLRDNFELSVLNRTQIIYHSQRQEVYMSVALKGQSVLNRRVHLDLNRKLDQGERWLTWDRDDNEALFLRKVGGVQSPHMWDSNGNLSQLDRDERTVNQDDSGASGSYTFEWFLKDDDFSAVIQNWHGRRKNCRFLQIEYFPRSATVHTVNVYRDGVMRQAITFSLVTAGVQLGTPQATLPFLLGFSAISMSIRRRMEGQCVRLALQGMTTTPQNGVEQDFSLTRVLIGFDLAG